MIFLMIYKIDQSASCGKLLDKKFMLCYIDFVTERLPCSRMRVRDLNLAPQRRGLFFIKVISFLIF